MWRPPPPWSARAMPPPRLQYQQPPILPAAGFPRGQDLPPPMPLPGFPPPPPMPLPGFPPPPPPPQHRVQPHSPNYPPPHPNGQPLSANFPPQPQHNGQTAALHGHYGRPYGMPSPSAYTMPLHNLDHRAALPPAPSAGAWPPSAGTHPTWTASTSPSAGTQPAWPPSARTQPLLGGAGQARALGVPLTPRLAPIPSINRAGTSLAAGATPQLLHGAAPAPPPPPLLYGPSLGFASPLLKDLSQKQTFIEVASATMGKVEEGCSKQEEVKSEAWKELIEIARQSMEILEALNPLPFPDYVEMVRPLQIPCDFVGAIPAHIPPGTEATKMTETFRTLVDSLVSKIITTLEGGRSWGGKWTFHDVLVSEGRCVIKIRAKLRGIRKNAREDLRLLHTLITQCIKAPYPPHLERLLELLLNVPIDFDTDGNAKKEYLTSIKEHPSLASMARIVTLLLNFAQSKKCLPEEVSQDFRNILGQHANWVERKMKKKRKRGGEAWDDWRKKADRYTLFHNVRKRRRKKKEGKRAAPVEDKDDLYDLAYFFRNFTVHAPENMLDSNHKVQLEDYAELYHILVYHFGDAVADLVDGVFKASELHPLLTNTWKTYTTR